MYSLLDSSPKRLETIAALAGLSPAAAAASLLHLEMEDLAASVAVSQYIKQQ